MRGYLINPFDRTINEVSGDFTNYKTIYPAISGPEHQVDLFTVMQITDQGDTVYLDDEGLLQEGRALWRFRIDEPGRYYAGRGLVLGSNEEGDAAEPSRMISLAWLQREVEFTDLESTGELEPSREAMIDHPVLGRVPALIGGNAIVRPRQAAEGGA